MPTPAVDEPTVGWASGPLGEVQAADREASRQAARRHRAIAAFAASRPASVDRQPGEPGSMSPERWAARAEVLRPVSEWAAHELSIALDLTVQRAEEELARSLTLVHRLPRVLDALESGLLHAGHLWCLLEHVAPIADNALRARIEAELLTWMATRHHVTTPAQLGDRVRRVVARHNARDAARDLNRALEQRGVTVRPDRTAGMSVISALLTTPEAAALMAALGAYADALPADPADGRTRGQRMADCLLDLVLRPGESGLQPVQVALTVVAPVGALLGGDAVCEIDGQVVPAELVRALLAALTGHRVEAAAGTSATDTATDTEPGAEASIGAEPTGTAPPGGPARAVLSEDEDFALWSEEMERRILAGEFDAEPPPCYVDDDPPPDPGPSPADCSPPFDSTSAAPVPEGWWARADRAVDQASTALLGLQRALGHARRTVATAQRADAADEAAWARSAAGRVSAAPDALTALTAATDTARAARRHRRGRAGRPAPHRAHPCSDRCAAGPHRPARPAPRRPHRHRARRPCRRRRLPAERRPGPARPRPRPLLPLPRLPPPRAPRRRARPRHPLAGRPHHRGQPHRLLHRPPPRQAPGPRLAPRSRPGRHPHRHHTHRAHRRHHPTALLRPVLPVAGATTAISEGGFGDA
ncbi:DUF222 domain-containing protein [Geodermatophilus sp. SYSU D00700]